MVENKRETHLGGYDFTPKHIMELPAPHPTETTGFWEAVRWVGTQVLQRIASQALAVLDFAEDDVIFFMGALVVFFWW